MGYNETPTRKANTMLKRIKNLDPNTKTLIKVAAIHTAVAVVTVVVPRIIEKKIANNTETPEN